MGCKCNDKENNEVSKEMLEGVTPMPYEKSKLKGKKNPLNLSHESNKNNSLSSIDKEKYKADVGQTPNYTKKQSLDSSFISNIHSKCEEIFNYFNEIRTYPEQFIKEAEEFGVKDVINKVIEISKNCTPLIYEPFYNMTLSNLIQNNIQNGENFEKLKENVEGFEKMKNFKKFLFVVDGEVLNPKQTVWKLIKNNKDIAFDSFFNQNINYLVISCHEDKDTSSLKCYYLFLTK